MRSFDTWTYEEVEDAFGIVSVDSLPQFEDWLASDTIPPTTSEKQQLDNYRALLLAEINNWTSHELTFFFIIPLLTTINLYTDYYKPFASRILTFEKGGVSASGKVDFMLAKGKMIPKIPYFCLHEYKQENRRDNDPLGQLLIGMVASQVKNNDDGLPIYGCYVSGRNWFFVLLIGNQYCLSNAYNASDNDIYKVLALLKKCKELVDKHAQSNLKKP
jgi:hypothetical protein